MNHLYYRSGTRQRAEVQEAKDSDCLALTTWGPVSVKSSRDLGSSCMLACIADANDRVTLSRLVGGRLRREDAYGSMVRTYGSWACMDLSYE